MSRTIVDTIERRTCVAAGFAEEQVLKEHTAGLLAGGVCCKYGISDARSLLGPSDALLYKHGRLKDHHSVRSNQ